MSYRHASFALPLGTSHFAYINADLTLSYVTQRYDGQTGHCWGIREVDSAELVRLESEFHATPRLTYQPVHPPVSVCLPFGGFYYSIWSDLVDGEESSFAEYEAEKESSLEYHPETFQPEPLRIDPGEVAELLMKHCDYRAAYQSIARDYAESFGLWFAEELSDLIPGFAMPVEFEELDSPREYNFATDRVFAKVPFTCVEALFAASERNGHAALGYLIRERFTSYDGFRSYYDNELDSWLSKPLTEWDHNELQTLLLACLAIANPTESGRRIDSEVFDYGNFAEAGYQYFESAMDWKGYESSVEELRAEKRETAIEAGLIEPETISEPAYRCDLTPDLFA